MKSNHELCLVGFGGLGREILDALRGKQLHLFNKIVLFDDEVDPSGIQDYLAMVDLSWGGSISDLKERQSSDFCVCIGSSTHRARIHRSLVAAGHHPFSVIDDRAHMSRIFSIGTGSSVLAGGLISSRATIGVGCHIGFSACIAHDCVLGDFVTIGHQSNITGGCVVEDEATLGASVVLRPGVHVGAGAQIGAGAVVIKDVEPGATVVGNPARRIR